MLKKIKHYPDFHKNIILSDEAHLWLCGCVNMQNCRFWSGDKPEDYQELPLHHEKLTVWVDFILEELLVHIIYFFSTKYFGQYRSTQVVIIPCWLIFYGLNWFSLDLENMWFQQDDGTCHTANDTINLLNEKLADSIISRNWPIN